MIFLFIIELLMLAILEDIHKYFMKKHDIK